MNYKSLFSGMIAVGVTLCLAMHATAQVTLNFDAANRGPVIGQRHYGIFFEEINHAGDGGLYAELIRNRSFEDNATDAEAWTPVGNATLTLTNGGLLNEAQQQALNLSLTAAGDGVQNAGFWGINIVKGRTYRCNFWAKSDNTYQGNITLMLKSSKGEVLGQATVDAHLDKDWQKLSTTLTATGDDPQGSFALTGSKAGELCIDVVSLFPPTYKDRDNGCRPDLAELLEAMKPAFVRFPGGCYIEGQWAYNETNRFEWKKTIGPIEERPGHRNINWNYRVSDGLGFHEMLQLTEDLGAEPLFVVNMGMGHGWMVDYTHIEEYIQEALDAIEYCNGDVSTTYGALRAKNGHPEPFNLKLIEIGNENYNFSSSNNSDQSDHYAERYLQFYNAIKAQWPDMVIIGNVESWGTDNPSWRNANPVDAVDEHYYRNPTWFKNQYNKYDTYNRTRPKVYVGEYAVTSDFGTNGSLRAALGEAIFMLGMERNSDMCIMNSYAPIFVNENDQKWRPDMIRFNSSESYGTPSYHVQQLMACNVGQQNIGWTEAHNAVELESDMYCGISTWNTKATYDNVKITDNNTGQVIFADDFTGTSDQWADNGGAWNTSDGVLTQLDQNMQGKIRRALTPSGSNFTLEMDATKMSGQEGFLIAFNWKDDSNFLWWNIGGWGNTAHGLEAYTNGSSTIIANKSGSVNTGQTYHIKIEVNNLQARCYLDDELIHEVVLPSNRMVYASATIDDNAKALYIKLVNPNQTDAIVHINIDNATIASGDYVKLGHSNSEAENTIDNQNNVYPQTLSLGGLSSHALDFSATANSLNILRLQVTDIQKVTEGTPATAEEVEQLRSQLADQMQKFCFLHATATLPTATSTGATITWTLDSSDPRLSIGGSIYTQQLTVRGKLDDASTAAGTLNAHVTLANGKVADITYPVTLAPDDNRYGYLYCFMNSTKEITNYALGSKENRGKHFEVLLSGEEVFNTAEAAGIEGGTRDAFILRGEQDDLYLMATTDMCNAKTGVWYNYGMNLLHSSDLIHWESTTFDFRKGKSIFSDPDADTGCYRTDEEYAKINRVWAPQIIWDKDYNNGQGGYLIYYSLLSTNTGDNHDRIFYSYANADLTAMTQPRLFFDPGHSVIDADIVLNPYDGLYHMYYKHEGAAGMERGIYEATSPTLVGDTWTDIMHVTNEGRELVEGSSTIRLINEDAYNLYYMRYSGGSAYKVCETNHMGIEPTSSTNLSGTGAFQHGSFMTLTETEYHMLEDWSALHNDMKLCTSLAEQTGSDLFDHALAMADNALALRSVAQLATALPEARTALAEAMKAYKKSLVGGATANDPCDISALIINPDFSQGGAGWQGTTFTAANNFVAEQYDKAFDNYQVLQYMPAGTYKLTCQGFYRYGGKEAAYAAHQAGTEMLNAELYMNTATAPFVSLFSEEGRYTYIPYTYPDNVYTANTAFNDYGLYTGNEVTYTLDTPGDLVIGMRKSKTMSYDWTIFDNFKLWYYGNTNTAIQDHTLPEAQAEDNGIYNLQGVLVGHTPGDAAKLRKGMYIIQHKVRLLGQ